MNPVTKKRLIIILAIFIPLLIGLVVWSEYNRRQQPEYTIEKVDKDTGETISIKPNVTPERYNADNTITILGLSSLPAQGATTNQVTLLNESLQKYYRSSLKGKGVELLKILEPEIHIESKTIHAKLKYGENKQTDQLLITLAGAYELRVVVKNAEGTVFDSGQISYSNDVHPESEQNNETTPEEEIIPPEAN